MSEEPRARRVSYTQLEILWRYLNEFKEVGNGYNKTTSARNTSKKMWQAAAVSLNAETGGATKDWKGWNKYWNDYKSKLKKIVASIRAKEHPSNHKSFTDIEKKFLTIMGRPFKPRRPKKLEPVVQVSVKEEPLDQVPEIIVEIEKIQSPRLVESADTVFTEYNPSTFKPKSESLNLSEHEPQESTLLHAQSTQNTSKHRRRIRRRPVPMSNDTARTLIAMLSEKSRNDSIRNDILQQLVEEIRDVKEILRVRLPALPKTCSADVSPDNVPSTP